MKHLTSNIIHLTSNIIHLTSALLICSLFLTACSSDDSELEGMTEAKGQFTYTMHLDDSGIFAGNTTRGHTVWADQSTIYLRFLTEDAEVTGLAVYSSESGSWTVTTDQEISLFTEESDLTAYFFDGEQSISEEEPDVILLTPQTGIYASEGKYTHPTATDIHVKTQLLPLAWRLCLRGTEGQTVTFTGSKSDIFYPTKYYLEYGDIEYAESDFTLTVGSNGSTPYVYGWFVYTDDNTLCVTTDADYRRTINAADIVSGNSVYCQIPTADNYQEEGWEKVEE